MEGDKFSRCFCQEEKITNLPLIFISNQQTRISIYMLAPVTYTTLKKSIPYSQALRLSRICSEKSCYDKRYNELEVWLTEWGYSDKLVRQQVLKARKHKIKDLLNNLKDKENGYKLVFNINYHPKFSNLKDTMSFLHLLLTPDQEHQKVFHKVPIVGF